MKYEEIFKTRFDALNEEQKQAVNLIEGPLLVIAGPGSGKTELLSMRVANILKQTDALPSSILCLTFTDSAAFNMRHRLIEIIGEDAYKVSIHTFHSFGREIIAYNSDYFSEELLKNSIDEIQTIKILEDIFKTLDHKNPLEGKDGKNKFYDLKPTEKTIHTLKKEGITPEEFKKILEENEKFLSLANPYLKGIFPKRMGKEFITEFKKLYESLKEIKITNTTNFKSLSEKILEEIEEAIAEFEKVKNSKPLTEWKRKNIIYDDDNTHIFKETKNQKKLLAVSDIYKQYQTYLKTNDLFDFQDMIMEAISAIEKYPNLKATLQERNQYVLIDEFQDTSAAQLKLIESVLDFELADGNPNVMAVGDDDQSIFKFQGANLENMMNFRTKFPKTTTIVLNKNYRSNQKIISFIRHNIKKGKDRLETRFPDITKELICGNKNISDGEIVLKKFVDEESELFFVCEKIKELIEKNKIPAEEIAIITTKHETLGHTAKYLDQNNINVYYEREENILDLPHIKPIITILKFTENLLNENFYYSNHLLPEILSYEFFEINAVDIYKISLKAYTEKSEWLSIMLEHENENIKNLAKFLIALGKLAKTLTAEELIDIITGIKELTDGDFSYTSNYKNFYFNDEKFKNEKSIYIKNLNNLKSLIVSIRKLSNNKAISIKEILAHFDFILDNNLRFISSQKINSTSSAVNLLTVHKAKGLEFHTVFLINCQQDEWVKTNSDGRGSISLPKNLPIDKNDETSDDKLRLFYVAASRAKTNLFLSYHEINENKAKDAQIMEFLTDYLQEEKEENKTIKTFNFKQTLENEKTINLYNFKNNDEKAILKDTLQKFKLSITHLNNFIDLINSGPIDFLENSLLKFPQKINTSNAYGSAVHNALNVLQRKFQKETMLPSIEFLLEEFEKQLLKQRLNKYDFEKCLNRGNDHLKMYFEDQKNNFNPTDKPEVKFNNQGVIINNVPLNGTIDKMKFDFEAGKVTVVEYKTGKALNSFEGQDDSQKIKSLKYRNQLTFYKLLVENSKFYKMYKVEKGLVEFIDPKNEKIKILEHDISAAETETMKKLISAVYTKIMNLDFPDTSKYKKSFKGSEDFINDLLSEKI